MADDWGVAQTSQVQSPSTPDPWGFKEDTKYNPKAAEHTNAVVDLFKRNVMNVLGVADFVAGTPAYTLGTGAQATGTLRAMSEGSKRPFEQGREVGRYVAEEAGKVTNPVQLLIRSFELGDAYEQAETTKGLNALMSKIDAAGKWVEDSTGGRIPREFIPMMVDTLLVGAGGLRTKPPSIVPDHVVKAVREHAVKMKEQGELEAQAKTVTPLEEVGRAPVQQQINSMLGIRTPAEQAKITRSRQKDIKQTFGRGPTDESLPPEVEGQRGREYSDAGESQHYAEERLQREEAYAKEASTSEQKAALTHEEAKQLVDDSAFNGDLEQTLYATFQSAEYNGESVPLANKGFRPDEIAGLERVGLATNGRMTETQFHAWNAERGARLSRKSTLKAPETPTEPPRTGQAEVLDALRTPGEERSPEQLQLLKDAAEARRAYDAREQGIAGDQAMKLINQAYRGKEKGAVSPEVIMLMGAAGVGALAGSQLDEKALRGLTTGGLVGAALAFPHLARGASVPSFRRQAGAVKAPGGMWHPEAVERLSTPLHNSIVSTGELPSGFKDMDAYSDHIAKITDRITRNYLNKYAGTERDPLKDVEIPFGNGVKRWEELMDSSVSREAGENIPGGKAGEIGYNFGYKGAEARETPPGARDINAYGPKAITSYLSHAGDFARQNIPPEKLGQYDLVRLIKETNANDARVAKEMEKAAAASTKDLPVYKEYPDGMKWVELKEPKELTPELEKRVRRLSKNEIKDEFDAAGEELNEAAYVALDSKGKPIRNSYTDEIASAPTKKKAVLAGWLAEEGNQMGHCVGGYCEGVASGESRIFSLRDKKGQSHVTVEVEPTAPRNDAIMKALEAGEYGPRGKAALASYKRKGGVGLTAELKDNFPDVWERITEGPPSITQIKGKQNRAPNKEYLSYVQDFVKGGKWEEVRDLENTGLREFRRDVFAKEPAFIKKAEALVGDARYVNEADYKKLDDLWQEHTGGISTIARSETAAAGEAMRQLQARNRGPAGQRGSIDRQLLMGLGAMGLGGLVGSQLTQDPSTGALLGALAPLALKIPGAKERFAAAREAVDWGIGNLSTRIANISPAIAQRGRLYEMRVLTEARDRLDKVMPFLKSRESLPKSVKDAFDRAVLTGNPTAIRETLARYPEAARGLEAARAVLRDLGEKLAGYGRFKGMKDEYFPRLVKDYEGLMSALGQQAKTRLETVIGEAEKAAEKARGTGLTDIERSVIINRELRNMSEAQGFQPGYSKARTIKEITEKIQPFYYTPAESLFAYIQGATKDLEMARFFGKDLVQTEKGGARYTNIDQSVGNYVGRELKEGNLKFDDVRKLEGMLKSRFKAGEMSSGRLVQEIRNMANLGLLGNLVSAATQGADALMSLYAQDFRSTLTAMARQFTGGRRVSTADFGLAEHVAEEFVSQTKTANWLNKTFHYSGFSAIDQFGKNVLLEAALARYERLSRSPNGVKMISQKYARAYGNEFPALVDDLKKGALTERVRAMLFSELSDMQPVSKMEMPQGYLDNPNGRLVYMLKTFMLKQMDVVRRDVVQEMQRGNIAKGLKNATAYAAVLGISGAATDVIKNWLMGRPMSFNGNDIAENVLKTFGPESYVVDKMKQGHPIEALIGAAAPPYKMMDDILRRDPKAVQYIPILGKLYYNWELGGREEAELREEKKARKAGKDYSLSSRAESYKEQKRDKAREKRENR